MDKITLEVTEGVYSTAKEAREAGRIPIVYYGKGKENHGFSVDYQEFRRAYGKGGRSTLFYFKSEKGNEFPVLVQDIQYHPVSDLMTHIDVMAVNLKETVRAHIPLVFVGISPAVKDLHGVLTHNKDSVEVECLPGDLISSIEVDIAPLVDFHSTLTVGDINFPSGLKVIDAPDISIAGVSAPRSAIEEEAETSAEASEEGEDEEKKEGGESEEGAEK